MKTIQLHLLIAAISFGCVSNPNGEVRSLEQGCPETPPYPRIIALSEKDYFYLKDNGYYDGMDAEFLGCIREEAERYKKLFCKQCVKYCSIREPNQPLSKDFRDIYVKCGAVKSSSSI